MRWITLTLSCVGLSLVFFICSGQNTDARCAAADKPAAAEACNTTPCPSVYWQPYGDWGACTQRCAFNGVAGTSSCTPATCMIRQPGEDSATATSDSACLALALDRPLESRPCNTAPCPSLMSSWRVGEWGPCSQQAQSRTCGQVYGVRTRAVDCVGSDGTVLSRTACERPVTGTSTNIASPEQAESCLLDLGPCACTNDRDCNSRNGHLVCLSGTCVCGKGWGGTDCSVTVPMTTAGSCVGGVIDVDAECCLGAVDAVTGKCCPAGSATDRNGACCDNGVPVDACGVCGGSGLVVDVLGACCSSPLPPSGICCVNATVDSCGVCGGTNSCGMSVSVSAGGGWLNSTESEMRTLVSQLLRVAEDSITSITAVAEPGGRGRRLVNASSSVRSSHGPALGFMCM